MRIYKIRGKWVDLNKVSYIGDVGEISAKQFEFIVDGQIIFVLGGSVEEIEGVREDMVYNWKGH